MLENTTVQQISDTPTEHLQDPGISAFRDLGYFLADQYAQSGIQRIPEQYASHEAVDENAEAMKLRTLPYVGTSVLKLDGTVQLSQELNPNFTITELKEKVGFLDEDSFAFVWQTMERLLPIEGSLPAVEEKAEQILTQFKRFIANDDVYDRVKNDERLRGIFKLNAAVELSEFGDFESAAQELDAMPEVNLRGQLKELLRKATVDETTRISHEQSISNLHSCVESIGAGAVLDAYSPDETRIVTNRTVDGMVELFDPFSDARVYASVRGADSTAVKNLTASSKDNEQRRISENALGHKRGIFYPRIIYGAVVEVPDIEDTTDSAWNYGDVRYVLKNEGKAVSGATYTFGDSMNGQKLDPSRILLREEADIASEVIHEVGPQTRIGSITHYVEAQLPGIRLNDIDAIVIRRSAVTPAAEKAIEIAGLQGIKTTIIEDAKPS